MLAVAGGKGGVGKTTVALGLAAAASRAGASAVVVDADREMPDLHAVAGLDEGSDDRARPGGDGLGGGGFDGPGVQGVADGVPPGDALRPWQTYPGVGLLPAAPGTGGDAVRRALDRLAATVDPDLLLVDSPAGAGRDAARPLRLADAAVLVTTADHRAVRDCLKTAAMARALDAPPLGYVLTRHADAEVPPPHADAKIPTRHADAGRDLPFAVPCLAIVPEVADPLEGQSARTAYSRVFEILKRQNA